VSDDPRVQRSAVPTRARRAPFCAALVAITLALFVAEPARAETSSLDATFRYTEPQEAHYFRAALEQLGLLSLGLAHYYLQRDVNSQDWDLAYDWNALRSKLDGTGYALDTNYFETNYLTHPGAGMLYYLTARGNRLNVLESLFYAVSASTMWEYLGEFRERVSVNDAIITPLSGFVLGETTFQLGAFFDRSCDTGVNRWLGTVFAPFKTLHDAIDGAKPARARDCDRFGLERVGARRLVLSAGQALVFELHRGGGPVTELRLAGSAALIHLYTYGRPGRGVRQFSDGNISRIELSGALTTSRWTDLRAWARIVPVGLHYRNLRVSGTRGLVGHETIVGLGAATEYHVHRYTRSEPRAGYDRWFTIEVPAAFLHWTWRDGSRRIEAELDAGLAFGGVDTLALSAYLEAGDPERLSTVTREHGYNHAVGLSLSPRVRFVWPRFEIGTEVRSTRVYGIDALDRFPAPHDRYTGTELRRSSRTWFRFTPEPPARLSVSAETTERRGRLGPAWAAFRELALVASLDMAF